MKCIRRMTPVLAALCSALCMTGCDSFYQMFIDEEDASEGVYFVVYNENSSEEDLASIPEASFMKSDLRDKIKEYGLSFEVTLTFDPETSNEASLSFFYYKNRDNVDAGDYCEIGNSYLGTYVMEGDTITFTFEPEGYNTAFYNVGSDLSQLEDFQAFSYAEDGSCGIWAYEFSSYEYEETAVILEDVIENLPEAMEITVSGKKILSWEAVEENN